MSGPSEKEAGWGGDSNAEWLELAAEAAHIGTWEFDLEQGTGFISEQCAEIIGYPKALRGISPIQRLAFFYAPGGPEADQSSL